MTMYSRYFGFKERPFKLVPNPAYLFMGKGHEEALAHLQYASAHGDGFVEITGEVGTGKTTLCRVFLDSLDKRVEAAYIFNPKLDPLQLLKTINAEFGLADDADNTKALIDILNRFLIAQKAEGKTVILIIDEAQNLSAEVLEQLRLLSNLETTQSKLLQIMLVGQPELAEMLESYELRQLAQRINLQYELPPLNFKETQEYIEHRIHIASQKPAPLFTQGALREVYRYSVGVPRRINIICDRSLLTAFSQDKKRITGRIVRQAIGELAGRRDLPRYNVGWRTVGIGLALLGLTGLGLYLVLSLGGDTPPATETGTRPAAVAIKVPPVTPAPAKAVSTDTPAVAEEALVMATGTETAPVTTSPQVPAAPVQEIQSGPGASDAPPAQTSATTARLTVPETVDAAPALDQIETAAPQVKTAVATQSGAAGKTVTENRGLLDFISQLEPRISRRRALKTGLTLWGRGTAIPGFLDELDDDNAFFTVGAGASGLQILPVVSNFELLKRLNLPVILAFRPPDAVAARYLVLKKRDGRAYYLADGGNIVTVIGEELLKQHLGTMAYVPWRNFKSFQGTIPVSSPEGTVLALKLYLKELGFEGIALDAEYDEQTLQIIKDVQAKHGVGADGYVGPLTKIVLYNELSSLDIPHLSEP
jgi:general secretion pathway protein A